LIKITLSITHYSILVFMPFYDFPGQNNGVKKKCYKTRGNVALPYILLGKF